MFGIIKNFVNEDLVDNLRNEIKFRQDKIVVGNTEILEERKTCWMSELGYNYKYGSKIMYPDKYSPTVRKIKKTIQDNYGINYDSVLINYYKDGTVGMRYHSDEIYDEWYEDTVVISFGSSRYISFREIKNYENKEKLLLENGDLLFMKKGCQQKYQHRVVKDKKICSDRISLVFKKHI
jgi:alkylated DNA repair dioxygenase AlkB